MGFPRWVHACQGVSPGGHPQPVARSLCIVPPGEDTPPFSGGVPTDRLPQLYRQHSDVEAMRQAVLLLFYTSLDAALSRSALRQCILHQACMNAPLPEVQSEVYPRPYIPGLAGAQCLCQDHMGEDEGFLGIPLPVDHPSPLHSQDCSKPALYLPWVRLVPAV